MGFSLANNPTVRLVIRGLRAVICMSNLVPQATVGGIRALGAEVKIFGRSQNDAIAS